MLNYKEKYFYQIISKFLEKFIITIKKQINDNKFINNNNVFLL